MTPYDELAEANADEECMRWLGDFLDAKEEIVSFVASRRPGQAKGEFDGYLKGSFNFCVSVKFNDGGPRAIIRFPKPGHTLTTRREEKVKSEVRVLEYLRENTSLSVPRITSWGLAEESPQKLGPFIIMDRIEGVSLTSLLRQPINEGEEDIVMMRDDIDVDKLDFVYEQLAEFIVELSRLEFDAIGAITKDADSNKWSATERPFTYNMNEMAVTVLNFPLDTFPTSPFQTTKELLDYQSDENLANLRVQRNLCRDEEVARRRYIARHRIRQLIPKFCKDNHGPFKLYCDDLQPGNIIVDPETYKIQGILDWEWTHAMPAQFSYDPPWWLILKGPSFWLESYTMKEFLDRYEPKLKQFLAALERVEAKLPPMEPKLSARMRESWESGQFWFDFGIRKTLDVDEVYWGALHKKGDEVLDEEEQKDLEKFTEQKMKDVREYDKECKERGL